MVTDGYSINNGYWLRGVLQLILVKRLVEKGDGCHQLRMEIIANNTVGSQGLMTNSIVPVDSSS